MFGFVRKGSDNGYTAKHSTPDGQLSTMERIAQEAQQRAASSEISLPWDKANQNVSPKPVPYVPGPSDYVPSQGLNTTKIIEQAAAPKHASEDTAEPSDSEPKHAAREDYSPTKAVGTSPVGYVWLDPEGLVTLTP